MASATVIPFPTKNPGVISDRSAGNLYRTKAAELIAACESDQTVALRINADGDVSRIEQQSEFFSEAIMAPGFACLCSSSSDPRRIAQRLQLAHLDALTWVNELSEA